VHLHHAAPLEGKPPSGNALAGWQPVLEKYSVAFYYILKISKHTTLQRRSVMLLLNGKYRKYKPMSSKYSYKYGESDAAGTT